jgi:hypothetical protein
MGSRVRSLLFALLVGALVGISAPAALAAETPEIKKFVAVNCKIEGCFQKTTEVNLGPLGVQKYIEPNELVGKEAFEQGFPQAGGRVPYGVTDFKVAVTGSLPSEVPTAVIKHIRTDVAPGLATDPFAVPQCSRANFGETEAFPGSGTGFYTESNCAGSEVGKQYATVWVEKAGVDLALKGIVYVLKSKEGLASEYGVALELPKAITGAALKELFEFLEAHSIPAPSEEEQEEFEAGQYYAHTLIEGNVEWGQEAKGTNKGDYHDYFEIDVSTVLPLVASRLVFEGTKGEGDFVTNATSCPGHNTTTLSLTDVEKTPVKGEYTAPFGLEGCAAVPFEPSFALTPAYTAFDKPDGFTTEVGIPHDPTEIDSSQLKEATIKLPEGMTLNPSAAPGLTACTPAEARIHSSLPGIGCANTSELGTVSLEVPTLPSGSLTGKMYLGGPESGPITGPPYILYVDAESKRYGVSVRLKGEVTPNETTGQLTTVFSENPEQPFTSIALAFKEGTLAPVANPLACGTATSEISLVPVAKPATSDVLNSAFTVDSNGAEGACASPTPFAPTQSTSTQVSNGGSHTNYTFTLQRNDGEQYLSKVTTVLPAGLVGAIPAVALCTEAQAAAESCPAESLIGKVTVTAGSGLTPDTLTGSAYMTGPYAGAPYGMYISVPVVAGPFNLGNSITRATVNIDPKTGRVIVSSTLPTIVKGGVPVRLRKLSLEINRPGFLTNPTNCSPLATESTVTGLGGTSISLSSGFQVENCSALAFKPSFKAATSGNPTKAGGASLETTISEAAGQANIKSVVVQLPKQLPSRLTTLQKACAAATFEANPAGCSPESVVGSVRATTPALPGKLQGVAYLVGHAGAAFPDLDLVLDGAGVRIILVGNTDIKNSITTTTFATTPDVPVTSITVNLPMGPHSALAAFGSLCAKPLVMPTTIVGQNGVTVKQNTIIKPVGCGVKIVGHKVIGNTAYITVQTPSAGRVSGSGAGVGSVYRRLGKAYKAATVKVSLNRSGQSRRKPFKVRLRVGFVPTSHSRTPSTAFVTVTFR